MIRFVRLLQVQEERVSGAEAADGADEFERLPSLGGYVPEQVSAPQLPGTVWARGYLLLATATLGEPVGTIAVPIQPSFAGDHQKMLKLRPVGRLLPAAGQVETSAFPGIRTLRPVGSSGQAYSITSPPARRLVTPELAEALETVFEHFAQERGFTPEKPLEIQLSRGFKASSHGHGEGRAADISSVGGKSLLAWKQEWDQAMAATEKLSDQQQRAEALAAEQKRNLGYGLYKALQEHGRWRVDPKGWRPYRGVVQLFGPWTPIEGPWKAMQIKTPNPYQRQRLADQQWMFQAHQDHIHVAR